MNWVSCVHSLFVFRIVAFRGELLMLRPVKIVESTRDGVAGDKLGLFNDRLEEPSSDDLETFFGAGRPPRRLYATNGIPKSIQSGATSLSAHFDIVRLD